jgi:N-acetylneuraminate synthase
MKFLGFQISTLNNNALSSGQLLLGANFERHFTDTMQRTGPDIVCSMDGKKQHQIDNFI